MKCIWFGAGVALIGLGAAAAFGQTGVDTVTGGFASQGALPPQQGPINGQSAVAIENALAPIGATGANNNRELAVEGSARQDMRVQEQNQRESTLENRAGAAATSNTWRYARSNGHWWYWMPNNRWAFLYGNRWVPFDPATYGRYYPMPANSAKPASSQLRQFKSPGLRSVPGGALYRGSSPPGRPASVVPSAAGAAPRAPDWKRATGALDKAANVQSARADEEMTDREIDNFLESGETPDSAAAGSSGTAPGGGGK